MTEHFEYAFTQNAESLELTAVYESLRQLSGQWQLSTAATDRSAEVDLTHQGIRAFFARSVRSHEAFGVDIPSRVFEISMSLYGRSLAVQCLSRRISSVAGASPSTSLAEDGASGEALNFFISIGISAGQLAPSLVTAHTAVENLLSVILCDSRVAPLIIAGPDADTSVDELKHLFLQIGTLCGVHQVDQATFELLNDELGIAFALASNGYRYFSPRVRLEDQRDSVRHPSIRRSDSNGDWLCSAESLNFSSLEIFSHSTYPIFSPDTRTLIEQEIRQKTLTEIRSKNEEALQGDDLHEGLIRERLDRMAREIGFAEAYATEMQNDAVAEKSVRMRLESITEELQIQLDQEQRTNLYFRNKLVELGASASFPTGIAEDVWGQNFQSYTDVCAEINSLPYLRFTGKFDTVHDLDLQPGIRIGVNRTWNSIHALSDYARLKQSGTYSGSFYEYLQSNSHDGYKVSLRTVAMGESESIETNPGLRELRLFSVPESVSGGGTIYMGAHFKLLTGVGTSPRMHFFDNTSGDGIVYIGYVGCHLQTANTN